MKELSDKKFDELLKQKAESFDFDFDQSAWEKMEQKLRKRDRVIFFRNSSFVLILLMLAGGAYFLTDNKPLNEKITKEIKKSIPPQLTPAIKDIDNTLLGEKNTVASLPGTTTPLSQARRITPTNKTGVKNSFIPQSTINAEIVETVDGSEALAAIPTNDGTTSVPSLDVTNDALSISTGDTSTNNKAERKRSKNKKLAFSVTALAGPEFSSVKSIAGKKGTITLGVLVNAAISNKITVSSGLKYGLKNYQASTSDYEFQNPARASMISGIDASCNILEIPLQVSYSLFNNNRKKIQVSSGLSSYLMLKEEYNFKYTPQSGYKNYLLVKNNANQHYLSVLNLSASYQIKPKSSNIEWAIEPYVKLPLGGVGEGDVRLKSSGISLNLTYEISKKIK